MLKKLNVADLVRPGCQVIKVEPVGFAVIVFFVLSDSIDDIVAVNQGYMVFGLKREATDANNLPGL